MQSTYHMIHSLKAYSSMVFTCVMVSTIKFGPLSSPQKVTALPPAELPISLCIPLPLATSSPLSLRNCPILGVPYKQKPTIWGLL